MGVEPAWAEEVGIGMTANGGSQGWIIDEMTVREFEYEAIDIGGDAGGFNPVYESGSRLRHRRHPGRSGSPRRVRLGPASQARNNKAPLSLTV